MNPNYQQPVPQVPLAIPGAKMIKVPGILMIVFGAISIIFSIIGTAGSALLGGLVSSMKDSAASDPDTLQALEVLESAMGMLTVFAFLAIFMAIFELVSGIVCTANANKMKSAKVPMIFAIISIALVVISQIGSIIASSQITSALASIPGASGVPAGTSVASSIMSIAFGCVLPILVIVGAKKKNAFLAGRM